MHILIIGFSNIVKKRVLPALKGNETVVQIDIASRKKLDQSYLGTAKGSFFESYDEALSKSSADVVYISLVNSEHEVWTERALNNGFHVIVDKPAFTSLSTAERLSKLASDKGLCLTEALVFSHHPQISSIHKILGDFGNDLTRISVEFSFPPMDKSDFRYSSSLGGGALWDLGPYAVATGRVLFNEEPTEVIGRVLSKNVDTDIETSFSTMMTYSSGRSLVGHFGFDTQYRNCIDAFGPKVGLKLDRFFTTTQTLENSLLVQQGNDSKAIQITAADSFDLFLRYVFNCIDKSDWRDLKEWLIQDARVLRKLRMSCGVN